MESKKILNSLIATGAVDNQVAFEVLAELHQRGVINLVEHLNEQNLMLLSSGTNRENLVAVSGNIDVILNLLPDSIDDDVLAPLAEETSSVDDILGGR